MNNNNKKKKKKSADARGLNGTGADVLATVRESRDDLLAFLERMVAAESPSHVAEAQGPVFDLLEEAFDDIGYVVRRQPGEESGGSLVAAPRGFDARVLARGNGRRPAPDATPPLQLLLGHTDTVWPIGTLKTMPLSINQRTMRGPGVFDMKAGLAQTLFALRALHRLELEPALAPVVFVNSDEEIGSGESTPHIVRLARLASRVFVMEPALGRTGKLKTARKGVGKFVVRVSGKAAHAGLDPGAGASAILELSHQVQKLFDLNDPKAGVSVNVGTIGGGMRPNVIAPESQAVVDVRVPDSASAERVTASIAALEPVTSGVKLKITGAIDRDPLERTPRNQALWRLAQRLARGLRIPVEQGFAGGASDGNTTSPLAPTLDGLGAVGDGAHAAHEQINVARSLERCALLAMLVLADPVEPAGEPHA